MIWIFIILSCVGISIILTWWIIKKNLTPSPTGQITENIVSIKNGIANAFIYTKGPDQILIDTGMSKKGFRNELNKVNIEHKAIKGVFLTHLDPDHTGGLSIFRNVNIYIGKDSKIEIVKKIFDTMKNCVIVEDNEIIQVGDIRVQTISTPGHRRGHISYLVDDKYLFAGDLIRLKKGKVKPFFKFISSNSKQMLVSIKKVEMMKNIELFLLLLVLY